MKLTEQQLSQLFQNSSKHKHTTIDVGDCLLNPKLADVDAIVSDFNTAQAAQLATHFAPWSQQVAKDIQHRRQPNTSSRIKLFINQCLPKSPMMGASLAVVFTLSAVVFFSNQHIDTPSSNTNVATNDVINALPFEGDSDRLSRGNFDESNQDDQLFRANFS